ncbi:hypothetical protein [Desulfoluna spongiiphila]|uniref:Uncharacterized protein n=1 Tax=Desulfoluna spongiiphila TaxID=419481 RepID=A0A1G5H379_9BACT|nr:hypothetical protein [Desulfoluna spongiiphila]SCY58315.1 hypothetical protein SAMN05216233_112102 [Desulfoluna spongiiphila]
MPQFLFALLLTFSTDNANLNTHLEESTWLHGRWLHVAVSSQPPADEASPAPKCPREKHVLLFSPDGDLRKYSPTKGWNRLLLDVSVTDDTVTLQHQNRDRFCLVAQKTDEGYLKMCTPGYGDFYYKKLDPKMRLEEIDFIQPPTRTPSQSVDIGR